MIRAFICSPYSGDVDTNVALARRLCAAAVRRGRAPFAPHLLCPQFLRDGDEAERLRGIDCGLAFLRCCEEIWVYTANGISAGMEREIAVAEEIGIPMIRVGESTR